MAFLEEPVEINKFDQSNTRSTVRRVGDIMVSRPVRINAYEFVALAALRAKQLLAGCTPRLEGDHNAATMAQMEVAAGFVVRAEEPARHSPPKPAELP
jgi:DNA-directed RNA polymerase subunit K/omega